MSLNTQQILRPRETLETFTSTFEEQIKNMDVETIFGDVIGLDAQKRVLLDLIRAYDPVHYLIIGPPGNGKSLFLKCIEKAFPDISKFIDSTTSSGIGMVERIFEKGPHLRFLLVDEIEKFDRDDREVFLGLLEGKLVRDLKDVSMEMSNLKIFLIATCNDLDKMKKHEKPLMNRCDTIYVPELEYDTFLHVASKRLLKEKGIHSEELGRFIAQRVYADLGQKKDMRKCIRLARKSYARATDTNDGIITKDVIDEVVADSKLVAHAI
jgi:hypothetical protein